MTEPVTLTAREHEVLALIAQGLPNKLIADRLGFSEHNAKFHVFNITRKLSARSRAHVVTIAVQRGLLNLTDDTTQSSAALLERAMEAYRTAGGDRDMARQLVDSVFARPTAEVA